MGAKTAISAEEYLRTSFPDLDREYRDGELVERTLPDYIHGKTQAVLAALFLALRAKLALFPCVETRMRLRPKLILIPDVAVFYQNEPPNIPETPPLIAIEVLSVDDRMSAVRKKLDEYKNWGVPHVWLVDPHAKRLYTCDAGLVEVASLRVPELEIVLQPDQIFE
jgi:Uma2 family endonuclease